MRGDSVQINLGEVNTNRMSLWFDSIKEAKDFLYLLGLNESNNLIDSVVTQNGSMYVKHKTSYRKGKYWPIIDIDRMMTSSEIAQAPPSVIQMSEWQHQDFVIAKNGKPLLTVETTEHAIVWNNVAQRMPRLIRSIYYGVPAIIFQKIGDGSNDKLKGWYLMGLVNASKIFNKPCVAILFDDKSRKNAENKLSNILINLVKGIHYNDSQCLIQFSKLLNQIHESNKELAKKWYDEEIFMKANWLEINDRVVKVKIGVRPDAGMWKTNGTGGLDPYPGLVMLADLLLCREGPSKNDRRRKLVVEFKHIKEDFWWFKKYPTELYLQMLIDPNYRIADEVIYSV